MPDPTPDEQRTEEQQRRRDELLALLLALCFIDDGDIEAAETLWDQHSRPSYRGLLDQSGKYQFNPTTQLYSRASTGRVITPDELKRISISFNHGLAADVLEPDAAKVSETPTPDVVRQWAGAMGQDVKDAAIVQSALAAGGFDKLTPSVRQTILGAPDQPPGLRHNLSALSRFAADIIEKVPRANTTAGIVNRAGMYAESLSPLHEAIRQDSHKDATDDQGRPVFLYEKNVLTPGDNCHNSDYADGCVEQTELGWVPIGELVPIGMRTCVFACKCYMEFSLTGPAEEE